jgi:hypothetical protein
MPGLLLGSEQRRRSGQQPPSLGLGTTVARVWRLRHRSAACSGLLLPPLGSSPLSRNLSLSTVKLFEGVGMSLSARRCHRLHVPSERRSSSLHTAHSASRNAASRGHASFPHPREEHYASCPAPVRTRREDDEEEEREKGDEAMKGGASSGTRRRSRRHLAPRTGRRRRHVRRV